MATYTVKRGDTLSAIAKRMGTTVAALVEANGIANPNKIKPGQVIRTEKIEAVKPAARTRALDDARTRYAFPTDAYVPPKAPVAGLNIPTGPRPPSSYAPLVAGRPETAPEESARIFRDAEALRAEERARATAEARDLGNTLGPRADTLNYALSPNRASANPVNANGIPMPAQQLPATDPFSGPAWDALNQFKAESDAKLGNQASIGWGDALPGMGGNSGYDGVRVADNSRIPKIGLPADYYNSLGARAIQSGPNTPGFLDIIPPKTLNPLAPTLRMNPPANLAELDTGGEILTADSTGATRAPASGQFYRDRKGDLYLATDGKPQKVDLSEIGKRTLLSDMGFPDTGDKTADYLLGLDGSGMFAGPVQGMAYPQIRQQLADIPGKGWMLAKPVDEIKKFANNFMANPVPGTIPNVAATALTQPGVRYYGDPKDMTYQSLFDAASWPVLVANKAKADAAKAAGTVAPIPMPRSARQAISADQRLVNRYGDSAPTPATIPASGNGELTTRKVTAVEIGPDGNEVQPAAWPNPLTGPGGMTGTPGKQYLVLQQGQKLPNVLRGETPWESFVNAFGGTVGGLGRSVGTPLAAVGQGLAETLGAVGAPGGYGQGTPALDAFTGGYGRGAAASNRFFDPLAAMDIGKARKAETIGNVASVASALPGVSAIPRIASTAGRGLTAAEQARMYAGVADNILPPNVPSSGAYDAQILGGMANDLGVVNAPMRPLSAADQKAVDEAMRVGLLSETDRGLENAVARGLAPAYDWRKSALPDNIPGSNVLPIAKTTPKANAIQAAALAGGIGAGALGLAALPRKPSPAVVNPNNVPKPVVRSEERLTPGLLPLAPKPAVAAYIPGVMPGGIGTYTAATKQPSVATPPPVVPLPRVRSANAPQALAQPLVQPLLPAVVPGPAQVIPRSSGPIDITVNGAANSYINGANTGNPYTVGQTYSVGGYDYIATPQGFQKVGKAGSSSTSTIPRPASKNSSSSGDRGYTQSTNSWFNEVTGR